MPGANRMFICLVLEVDRRAGDFVGQVSVPNDPNVVGHVVRMRLDQLAEDDALEVTPGDCLDFYTWGQFSVIRRRLPPRKPPLKKGLTDLV